jgi:transposase
LANNKRRQYTPEFKQEAVGLVTKQQYTIVQAARSLGINSTMLARWRREYQAREQNAFPGIGHQSSQLEALNSLREENRRLRLEREILKKAAVFFARESG